MTDPHDQQDKDRSHRDRQSATNTELELLPGLAVEHADDGAEARPQDQRDLVGS